MGSILRLVNTETDSAGRVVDEVELSQRRNTTATRAGRVSGGRWPMRLRRAILSPPSRRR